MKPDFFDIMMERGLLAQCTNIADLRQQMNQAPITAYVGFDATADSLHIGHLVSLISMRWLAHCGHRVIALTGSATTRVGDPSFRNTSRPLLAHDTISRNVQAIAENIKAVLHGFEEQLEFEDNASWLGAVPLLDFMQDVGRHFSVHRMLSMDSVKTRIDQSEPLSMLEFSYMMLQAADFRHLARSHNCILQMGGSDQWGNICNGIELARRTDGTQLFGLTTNLLTDGQGAKMGKTSGGAIWLSSFKLPVFDFWQFWRNVSDADVIRFLKMFTSLPIREIEQIDLLSQREITKAKISLANEVTRLVHGAEAARTAFETASSLFGAHSTSQATHHIQCTEEGISIVDLLLQLGFATTKSEARRLISADAVHVDAELVKEPTLTLRPTDKTIPVRCGKKRRAVCQLITQSAQPAYQSV